MIWPFRRKAPPPLTIDPRMNEDWRVGDDAVCVCDGWSDPTPHDPVKGERLRVVAVEMWRVRGTNRVAVGLFFAGKPPKFGWTCSGFRKLRRDERAADAGFTARIKAKGPKERA